MEPSALGFLANKAWGTKWMEIHPRLCPIIWLHIRSRRMADYSDQTVVPTTRRTKTKALWWIRLNCRLPPGSVRWSISGVYGIPNNPRTLLWERRAQDPSITTLVLDGLIYLICELYIDDVLIDGADEDTFVNNVRHVFSRFRKHKIVVNSNITELGLEYVGHLVSNKGISSTKEKRQKIMNFEYPRTHKEMLMYVGLVNYSWSRTEHEWPSPTTPKNGGTIW